MSFLGRLDEQRHVNRSTAAVVGVLIALFGLGGIKVGLGHPFADPQGGKILGQFGVNLLSSSVHLLLAAGLLAAAATGTAGSRLANRLVGGACLLLAVYGLAAGPGSADLLAADDHTNDLHLLLALVLIAVGAVADRARTSGHGPEYRTVRY